MITGMKRTTRRTGCFWSKVECRTGTSEEYRLRSSIGGVLARPEHFASRMLKLQPSVACWHIESVLLRWRWYVLGRDLLFCPRL